MYKLFISLRYLFHRPISYLAAFILMLGVATLLIVTSVMGGFQREFHKKIRGISADVTVESEQWGISEERRISKLIEEVPHVVATAPYVDNIVLVDTGYGKKDYGFLRGIDPEREVKISELRKFLLSPQQIFAIPFGANPTAMNSAVNQSILSKLSDVKPDPIAVFKAPASGLPPVVLGAELANYMRLDIGDQITLISSTSASEVKTDDVKRMKFEVTGMFKTGYYDQDKRTLVTSIEAAQRFLDLGAKPASGLDPPTPARFSGINVKLDDFQLAHPVARDISRALRGEELYVLPWDQRNATLISAVATEQFMIYFIVFFMVVLAGASIAAILTLAVIEKTKELGVLRAVGATPMGLMQIFLNQGVIIAAIGAMLGLAFGLLFLRYINEIDIYVIGRLLGRRVFDPSIYYLDRIPNEVSLSTLVWCTVPPVVLGFFLAIYPAYRASTLEPMEALRYE